MYENGEETGKSKSLFDLVFVLLFIIVCFLTNKRPSSFVTMTNSTITKVLKSFTLQYIKVWWFSVARTWQHYILLRLSNIGISFILETFLSNGKIFALTLSPHKALSIL